MDVKFGLYRHVMFTLCTFAQCNVYKESFVLKLLVVPSHEGKQVTALYTSHLQYLDPKFNSPFTYLNPIHQIVPMETKAIQKEENVIWEEYLVRDERRKINKWKIAMSAEDSCKNRNTWLKNSS